MDRHAIEPRSEQPAPIAARSAWMAVEPRDLAHHVSMAAAVSAQEANRGFDHLVDELVAQVDATDPRQAGHSHRVSVLASMLGSSLGMDQRELRDLRAAALLHDVGKIMRRLLRDVAAGRDTTQDVTTLEDLAVLAKL
ncbi:MAG: HD domain-containing protein, partial [Phycisphaerales bacterium]